MPRRKKESPKLNALGIVAGKMKDWQPASKALTSVRAVETIFPQLNAATGIGGWPLQRVAVVHGPSMHGKTTFVHGLGLSFLERQHFYGFVDAEYTTPAEWLQILMKQWADNPAFIAMRPHTFEETVDAVRELVENVADSRATKEIPEETSALIAIDSLRKLVPKRLREIIEKEGVESEKSGGIDGMSGRAGQYKASLNAAWLDEVVPLLYHTNTTMVLVGRESQKAKKNKFDVDWQLTGGNGVLLDASLAARITRVEWLKHGKKVIGERHRIRIYKSKIASKEDKVIDCYFHTSNGVFTPAGFDIARDVLEMAVASGVVKKNGSWFESKLTGETWQGENAAVKSLTEDSSSLKDLTEAATKNYEPEEVKENQDVI